MSIIEQAVNALGKGKGKDAERKKAVEASVDSQSSESEAVNTVQRVEGGRLGPHQTAAAEIQNERVNPYASEAPPVNNYRHCANSFQGIAKFGYVDS